MIPDQIDHCTECGAENLAQKEDSCPECGASLCLISTWGEGEAQRYRDGTRYTTEQGRVDRGEAVST